MTLKITIDMEKARAVFREKMKSSIKVGLRPLNEEHDALSDAGMDISSVKAKRASLRAYLDDAAIDAAKTPEELIALWPAELTRTY